MNPDTNVSILLHMVIFLFFCNLLNAQKTEITGLVRDSITHEPINSVIIKTFDKAKLIAFCTTNNKGEYKLSIESGAETLNLNYEHIAYKTVTFVLQNKSQQQNTYLASKPVSIREVAVKAPEIIVKKDTVSYNVKAFTSAGDRNIEDVIKKLPGLKVADNGAISYQGKTINSFKIEDMNMLGGKYTLATKNVQAKDVSRVEVIENYQEVKQLQGEPTDQVAINLKLNKEAKNRLIGSAELGTGYRNNEILYHAAVTGMVFNKKWQLLAVAKANNWGTPLSGEVMSLFGEYYGYNIADALVSSNLTSYPPIGYSRLHRKQDLMTTVNSLVKLSKSNEIIVNADYLRRNDDYNYEIISNYFLGNSNVIVNEKQWSEFLLNSLRTKLSYTHNSDKFYLKNSTTFEAKGLDNSFDLLSNGNAIGQDVAYQFSGLHNRLDLYKKSKKRNFGLNSNIRYSNIPNYTLTFSNIPNVSGIFRQKARGNTFSSDINSAFAYQLGKHSNLGLSVTVRVDYDKVFTTLQKSESSFLNRNDGYKINTTLSPSYNLVAPDARKYSLNINVPVNILNIAYRNQLNRENDFSLNRPFFNPSIRGFYQLSPFSKISLSGGLNANIGDIADFVLNPIQNTYKSQSVRSGILAQSQSLSSGLNYEFKNPLKLFFASGSISYGNTWRNLLNSQLITPGNTNVDINTTAVADRNIAQNASISGNVSKDIRPIATSISLNASYGLSSGQHIRQGVKTEIQGNSLSFTPTIISTISKKLELNYRMSYTRNMQSSVSFSNVYRNQSHRLNLSYNPLKTLIVYSSFEFARFELAQNEFKNTLFLDGGVRYKYKKAELELKLNNLLNSKSYSYSVVNDLDRYTYTYYLNPREIVFICKFNL